MISSRRMRSVPAIADHVEGAGDRAVLFVVANGGGHASASGIRHVWNVSAMVDPVAAREYSALERNPRSAIGRYEHAFQPAVVIRLRGRREAMDVDGVVDAHAAQAVAALAEMAMAGTSRRSSPARLHQQVDAPVAVRDRQPWRRLPFHQGSSTGRCAARHVRNGELPAAGCRTATQLLRGAA